MKTEEDLFDDWIELKKDLNSIQKFPHISEGEVWWCGIGKNVGVEINGKSEKFSRPVIVYKKLSALGFLGIPMSTQQHSGSWYVSFDFLGKRSVAVLSQIRTISTMRLYRRMGELDETDFKKVREGFRRIYF